MQNMIASLVFDSVRRYNATAVSFLVTPCNPISGTFAKYDLYRFEYEDLNRKAP
jgi:hypothetical protein